MTAIMKMMMIGYNDGTDTDDDDDDDDDDGDDFDDNNGTSDDDVNDRDIDDGMKKIMKSSHFPMLSIVFLYLSLFRVLLYRLTQSLAFAVILNIPFSSFKSCKARI